MRQHVFLAGRTAPREGRFRPYAIAWLGLAALGVANGAVRVGLYEDRLGEEAAHQVSTLSAIALFGGYTLLIDQRFPIADERHAIEIGAGWAAATIAFELGFGRYVAGESWTTLLHDWNLAAGRTWPFAVLSIAAAPSVVRLLDHRRKRNPQRSPA